MFTIMKRLIYNQLIEWKNSDRRKPLILRGARQTGKTYILKEFGKNEYKNYIYINFEESSELTDMLIENLKIEKIIKYISIYTGIKIIPGKTLIIFDEIQAAPHILKSLKYFNEKFNEYHIVTAGSLLGVILTEGISFPVGKVNFLDLYPLSFEEFLEALNEHDLLSVIPKSSEALKRFPETFHKQLIDLLKLYYYIGGMPEVIVDYIKHKSFKRVRKIQLELIDTYLNDFSKHATKTEAIKIRRIWDSIPLHLGKENKAFIFAAINPSARSRDYEIALQWLLDAGLIIKTKNISRPLVPLNAYTETQFKIYLLDVGLLGAMTELRPETIIIKNDLFTHFKGALVENFVFQEVSIDTKPYYWSNEGKAEVDLIINIKGDIYPVEIKAGINLKAKSLALYDKLFNPKILFRSSSANFNRNGKILDIPLYALKYFITPSN